VRSTSTKLHGCDTAGYDLAATDPEWKGATNWVGDKLQQHFRPN
jgi:hypothetical protein